MNFLDLPNEVVFQIFSFLPIESCEKLLKLVDSKSLLYGMLNRNIYGRTILYLNNRNYTIQNDNFLSKMLFKYIEYDDFQDICAFDEAVIPERFVLSYHFNRSHIENAETEHDDFLDKFISCLDLAPCIDYFAKSKMVEISIDLFNKKVNSNEVSNLNTLLDSDVFQQNLSYISLNRFQRLDQDCLNALSTSLYNNLSKFKQLHTLTLSSNNLYSINDWVFPENLINLNLSNNKLIELPSSKDFLPENLIKLNISCNNIKNLENVKFPDSLQYLDIQLNNISKLSNVSFPRSLKVLIASGNNIMLGNDEVIDFPQELCYLSLLRNPYLNNIKALKLNEQLKNVYIDASFQGNADNETITFV